MSKKHLIDLKLIEKLAAMGCFQVEIAETLGISEHTWYNYLKDPELQVLQAYQRGFEQHREVVLGGLRDLAKERNPTALIFLAKAHFGRRDNMDITLRGDPDAPLQIASDASYDKLSSQERRARIAELEEKKRAIEAEVVR